jgi:hypothetical protein
MVRSTSCVLVFWGLVALHLHAQLNLQQKDETVMVEADQASTLRRLATDTEPSPKAPIAIDAERAVLATLSPGFRESCATMINMWASDGHPQNKALLNVRDLGRPDGASGRFLALRCSSTLPGTENAYDERLAYLYESTGNLVLRIFAHGKDTPGSALLSRIEPVAGAHFPGVAVAGFKIAESNVNPCCDGDTSSQERTIYTTLGSSGIYIAAALVNSWMDHVHDDIDGDAEVRLVTQWRAIRNRAGEIIEFVGQYKTTEEHEKRPKAKTSSGQMVHRWNVQSRRFEPIKTPPPRLIPEA